MSTATPGPVITCEKCKQGTMVAQRVPRMGNGLNIIGFTLLIPSVLLLLGTTACGIFMGGAATTTTAELARAARTDASKQLLDVADIPRPAAEAFAASGRVDQAVLDALPPPARERADQIVSAYRSRLTGAGLGTGAVASAAGLGVVATYVIGLPFLIIGLLLVRKKNVWRCPTCAYVFDRAG